MKMQLSLESALMGLRDPTVHESKIRTRCFSHYSIFFCEVNLAWDDALSRFHWRMESGNKKRFKI